MKALGEVFHADHLLISLNNKELTLGLFKAHEMNEREMEWWGRNYNKVTSRLVHLATILNTGMAMDIDL